MIFFIRMLTLLGCALLSLNLVGTDPSDIIFVGAGVLVLLFAPGALLLSGLSWGARLTLALVIAFYAVSCLAGWRSPSFILYFVSGLLFLSCLHFSTRDYDQLPIGSTLFIGFLLLNLTILLSSFLFGLSRDLFFDLARDGRYLGPLGDPNMTGLTGSFALYFFIDRAVRPLRSRFALSVALLGVLASATIVLMSGSRSAWGAAVLGLCVYVVVSRRSFSIRTVSAGIVLLMGIAVVSSGVFDTSTNVEDVSSRFRTIFVQDQSAEQERFGFVYTRAALDVAAQHPLGVGPGMTPMYTGIRSVDGDPIGAHNSYVEILAENGWVMAALLFSLLCLAGRRLYVLAEHDVFYNDISCRTILACLASAAVFGMGHDLLGWRIGWIAPVLTTLAAFSDRYPAFAAHRALAQT